MSGPAIADVAAYVQKLDLKDGDILVVDARAVDVDQLAETLAQMPPSSAPPCVFGIVMAWPQPGQSLAEAIRTANRAVIEAALGNDFASTPDKGQAAKEKQRDEHSHSDL